MASSDNQRIDELLSRLVDALRFLLDVPSLKDRFEYDVQSLLVLLAEARRCSDELETLRFMWPQLQDQLFRVLNERPYSGLDGWERTRLVELLSDETVAHFTAPSTGEDGFNRAFENVFLEAGDIIHRPDRAAAEAAPMAAPSEAPVGGDGEADYNDAPTASASPSYYNDAPTASASPSYANAGMGYDDELPAAPAEPVAAQPSHEEPEPHARVVNTGFSERDEPAVAVPSDHLLQVETSYWFWLEIGELLRDSIEDVPTPLPASVPANAVLTVAVFSFPNELKLIEGADVGTVRLTGPVESVVVDQPTGLEFLFLDAFRERRLFFPVETPSTPGIYRLRCNIYYEHILLQSRIVTAHVAQVPDVGRALRSSLDFKLSHTLDPARLSRMGSQTLSIFINRNYDGTHGFCFEGEHDFKTQAVLGGQKLQDSLTQVRKALRRVAWGSGDAWQAQSAYRYDSPGEPDFFTADVIALAIRGYMLYSALIDGITGGAQASDDLAALMLKPGRVQISSKESASFVVPAALFYDHPLDTQAKEHSVCDAFLKTVRAHGSLKDCPCFHGQCPHLNELDVICPSGFWGYRHELGLPVSIELPTGGDSEPEIGFNNPASMVVIVSLDQMLTERGPHEERLKSVRTPLTFTLCDGRIQAVDALQHRQAEVVYFYCHGGMTPDNTPFLNIGDNENLTPDNIRAFNIRWKAPRPLVFMNGCMTAALEPEKAIEFVSAFINGASASGVIGTEITVFEPLATKFAEAFLNCFMGECKSVGESIKLARLNLLEQFNPLGLVYIPFALPGLHLVDLGSLQAAHDVAQTQEAPEAGV